ncbi:fimbrial biogenesis chaperone [Methyloradius palustris]|uniref:Fimbrial chaperone n=1 Tax=Methyloradius palustris TaxID=2778876 RepID=A0A8D5JZP4_9PROT|nr:fimbria/pilus periplasmic chaperone [Methyloradius palustris]BCM25872.1 fimbrial chaperone [Methyloradius palustris]
MQRASKIVAIATVWGAFVLLSGSALSGTALQISPLRIEFSTKLPSTTITVKNRGDSPSLVQAQIFRWAQQNGQDVLEPSRDVLVSPPVFTVKAGGEQILRALIRIQPQDKKEITYRLVLREVADQVNPDPTQQGVRVLLGFSLPVFINPANKPEQKLIWEAKKLDERKLAVALKNEGDSHIQVTSFQLENTSGNVIKQTQMAYVLSENERQWVFDIDAIDSLGASLTVVAKTDNGELREKVALERP